MAKTEGSLKGYAKVLISRWDDETESWYWAATQNGEEVARVNGRFTVLIPVTAEALEEACKGARTSFTLEDGTKIKVAGMLGPAARKYYADAIEPVRGQLREMGANGQVPDATTLQEMLDRATPYNGRGGSRTQPVDTAKAAEMTEEELGVYLASLGYKITS